jgi:alkylhydroperoxidase family enzyme
MHPRLELDRVAPDALKAVLQVSAYINNHSGLEPTLLNLVYLRASQINGCAQPLHRYAHQRCACFGRN